MPRLLVMEPLKTAGDYHATSNESNLQNYFGYGKIHAGSDLRDSIFGSPDKTLIDADFLTGKSEKTLLYSANDPAIDYNRKPNFTRNSWVC